MRYIALLLALVSAPLAAQVSYPPIDANTIAQQAVSAAQAVVPPTCTQPPAPDAMVATVGTGNPCTPRADAARATQIPPATAVTTGDGTFSGNWSVTLTAAPTRRIATIYGTGVPYHCQLASMSVTGFTGKCWALVATTLPSVPTALLSLVVSPVANTASGLTVNVFARQ